MKKKMLMLVAACLMTAASYAQFEQNKMFIGASTSEVNLGYNSTQKWKCNFGAKLGWMFAQDWLLAANGDFSYRKGQDNVYNLGIGMRYYIEQNGLFIGLGGTYVHDTANYDDIMPSVQLGYAFFLSRSVTIEPEVYYNQSLESHSKYSGVGFRLGFGIYL